MLSTAGTRDKLVTIQGRPAADTVDGSGVPIDPFSDLPPKVWMSKEDVTAQQRYAETSAANQLGARLYTQWQMPYRSDMDPDVTDVQKLRRLVYRSHTYDIIHAAVLQRPDGRGIQLFTLASSRTA